MPWQAELMQAEDQVASPCIGMCTLDQERKYCEGCLRTIDEIRAWRTMQNHERREVLEKIAGREAALIQ
ncbi:DUF1289 domain-containing protein [Methylobacillus arboreus]|uniref:DUF1289 domain-containing protein n=1 Tax=Methylobacillus arboreus TaxID=755170 RepID=UPI001E415C1E|nr:DUF1289 domain-containing protein [Methylobacillus arboreus]MCB5190434.1 DUF1289 domain-containing protein [Methylobacillus arboreus]